MAVAPGSVALDTFTDVTTRYDIPKNRTVLHYIVLTNTTTSNTNAMLTTPTGSVSERMLVCVFRCDPEIM